MELSAGTVTLLFTDIEGSTALLHELGDAYLGVLADHHRLVRDAIDRHGGLEVRTEGDSFFVGFASPSAAAHACRDIQLALARHQWIHGRPVRVRMGLHTGAVNLLDGDYAGLNVHEAARVSAAAYGGQVLASQATVDAIAAERAVPSGDGWIDLGLHVLKDFPQPRRLFQLAHPDLPAIFPPPRTLTARDHNLPAMATSFVGRAADLAYVQSLLASPARLITLTGGGGLGKTRLAIEAAWSVLSRFREGAWLVSLAVVTDPARVLDAVAAALGVAESPGVSLLEGVVGRLSGGPTLLVLDNLEHLLSGVTVVSDLLEACPSLVVLATSRERLHLRGEHEVLLDGLDDASAVALFAERALAARRDVILDERIERWCQRLGGIPLAIELAAARLRTHAIDDVLLSMDSVLDLLERGERDRPIRHQAMRATIGWSVDALTEAELSVFRSFSVFVGGATREAVIGVCGPKGDVVDSLVEKSLIKLDRGVITDRLLMLEPVRQYAEERLAADEPGERERRLAAHADWFLALAEEAEPHLVSSGQAHWLDVLTDEHANLRAAWERGRGDIPLRIASCLTRFWAYRGHASEGRTVLALVLGSAPEGDPAVRAKALLGAGHLAVLLGDLAEAQKVLPAAIALGHPPTSATARNLLGEAARIGGDFDEAERCYDAALRAAEALHDDRLAGIVRNNQGAVAFARRDFAGAADHWRAALASGDRLGEPQSTVRVVGNLGLALRMLGDREGAREAFTRSLELARSIADKGAEASALQNLAATMVDDDAPLLGDALLAAAGDLRAAIEIYETIGFRRELASALLAVPSFVDGPVEATRALKRARSLFVELGDTERAELAQQMLDTLPLTADDELRPGVHESDAPED